VREGKNDWAKCSLARGRRASTSIVSLDGRNRGAARIQIPPWCAGRRPETLDADAATEVRPLNLKTPYRALAMAVRNEERPFAFRSYLAASSDNPRIKKASETMAKGRARPRRHAAQGTAPRLSPRTRPEEGRRSAGAS
jgi:hypothetical protein